MPLPPPDRLLEGTGLWAYLIIALVMLGEAIPLIGAMIPAQLFLLGAGFLVALHELRGILVILIAFAGLFTADIISFALGRRFGNALIDKLPGAFARRAHTLSTGLGTHLAKTMIFGKFLGPARALTPPLAGAARVGWLRFLFFEAIGSFVWVIVITSLGFFFGRSYVRIERWLGRGSLVLVLVAVVVYLGIMRFRHAKQADKTLHGELPPPPPPLP